MRKIDNPHHPEHEREPAGDHGVVATKQYAFDDGADKAHDAVPA